MTDRFAPENFEWPLGKWVCVRCETKKYSAKSFQQTKLPTDPPVFKYRNVCKECERKEVIAGKAVAGEEVSTNALKRAINLRSVKSRDKQHATRIKNEDAKKATERELEIRKELASRELARRSLLHFTERHVKGYIAGWVHEDICRRLEQFMRDVEEQKSPRLMLWLPPRAGKSEIASTQFPSWVLGHHPDWEFISCSYSVELPLGFSRKIRSQVQMDEYKNVFKDTFLSRDSQSAESWRTTRGGGFRAAGVGGGITGMGAHILVIDDPVKDATEADSETTRQSVWDWFGSTAYTRLAPGGGVLVIQTRWHDDDLSGRLERVMNEGFKELNQVSRELKELGDSMNHGSKDGARLKELNAERLELSRSIDRWEIVKYPALAESDEYLRMKDGAIITVDSQTLNVSKENGYKLLRKKGEALHPDRFPLSLLMKYKRTLQPRHWSALYQQNPTPDEGMFFTKDMFRYRPYPSPSVVDGMYRFVAWDLAIGTRTSNDWTVGIVGGVDWEDTLWILDMVRGRWQTQQIAENILTTHVRYKAMMTGIEKGQLELAIKPQLEALMKQRKQYITLAEGEDALKPVTDKVMRARPLQGRMQQGRVVLPSDQPWVEVAQQELLRFPTGLHDDVVDACSWLVRMVTRHGTPSKPNEDIGGGKKFVGWRERLNGMYGHRKHFMAS